MEGALVMRMDLRYQRLLSLLEYTTDITTIAEDALRRQIELVEECNLKLTEEIRFCMEKCSQMSSEKLQAATEVQFRAEEWLITMKALLKQEAAKQVPEAGSTTTKLPKLSLPKFKGDVLRWSDFWDRFESNVDQKPISEADKLAYLIGCLEEEALQAVEGLTISNLNYQVAVNILKERYGNNKKVVDAHYKAINNMPRAGLDVSECRATLDSLERYMRVLQTLGQDINGDYLQATVVSKFPEKVVYDLHLLSNVDDMEAIRTGLKKVITAMEIAKVVPDTQVSTPLPTTPKEMTTGVLHVSQQPPRANRYKNDQGKFRHPTVGKGVRALKRKFISDKEEKPKKSKIPKKNCIFCSGTHYNADCTVVQSLEERKKKLGKRCYACFREGHRTDTCSYKRACYFCKGKHNQALCTQNKSGKVVMLSNLIPKGSESKTLDDSCSYLQTAVVEAGTVNSRRPKPCRILLDSGSQRSYVTKEFAKELQLASDREDLLMIFVFGADSPVEIRSPTTVVEIITRRGIKKTIRVNIVPHITNKIPLPLNIDGVDIVADDGSMGDQIQMLIGSDYYFSYLRNDMRLLQENLFLIDTDFGWMVAGKIRKGEEKENTLTVTTYCQCPKSDEPYFTPPDLPLREPDVKFLWALEGIGITDSPKVTREEEAVKQFNETVKYENNRYQVKWPWITYPPDLPSNYGLAYGRLSSLIRRLPKDTMKEYDEILKEQLATGIIEMVDPTEVRQDAHPVHYLAHHIVVQPGKRGRIVFDASAKVQDNKSLNECMYRGPLMLEDLTALLIKFRLHKIGITADIEKAFLQVGLQQEDRDVTRFLWLKDTELGITEGNIIHLRFCRVGFGIISSPFLLTATIRHHLSKGGHNLMKEIAERMYVDNLVTGSDTLNEARDLVNKTRSVFAELSMNIREWTSNNKQLMKKIPKQFQAKDTESAKVLGLTWHLESDTLKLRLNDHLQNEHHEEMAKTKRGILKTLASLYDPCGFAAPLILPAKLILQEMWKRKMKWDTPLPEELEEEWQNALAAIKSTRDIEVPRYVGPTSIEAAECELHGFTDASLRAFSAVVYLRIRNKEDNSVKLVFIMAKSRVTPIAHKEDLKIPKLELLGFVIGKRLLTYVKESLGLDIKRMCLWSDSEVVLYWMKSEKLLPPFVCRRINEIKQNKEIETRYVNTDLNPADLATRPELWQLKRGLWFNGPQFLLLGEEGWPKLQEHGQSALLAGLDPALVGAERDESAEQRSVIHAEEENATEGAMEVEEESAPEGAMEVEEESALEGAMEVDEQESVDQIIDGKNKVAELKKLQRTYFPQEVAGKETSLSRNLGLFEDMDGILRCKGRLSNTICSYDTKYPILIPKDSEFTDQLIRDTHEKYYHAGAPHTLSIIRQKYWIHQGKAKVQRIVRKCLQCIKHGGGPFKLPPTPALPTERANYSAPFTYTGLDYFGPIFITEKGEVKKRWVCLLTCLAVRAVHMEVVQDLTAEECLLAIRRFVAARGRPELIVSDNAQQFKLTAEVLSNEYCRDNGLRWKFIPQLSPWFGGFYERLVGVVKNCMKRTLGKKLLNDTQLSTVIKEIEAVTNLRPLTCVGSEIEYVLRPVDFLTYGKCISIEPSIQNQYPGGSVTKRNLIEGWKKGQLLLEEFKRMFMGQYLCSLRERYQHSHKEPRVRAKQSPQVGNIVQIKDDARNREKWKVGKIISLEYGADGECRVAKVDVDGKEFVRSIGHLYPLEVEDVGPQDRETPESSKPPRPRARTTSPDPEIEPRCLTEEPISQTEKNIVQDEVPVEENNETDLTQTQENCRSVVENEEVVDTAERSIKRTAALRTREKIALWTSQLAAVL